MSEDFHLEPLPADADTGDLLEALGPIDERPPESQYCVFRSGRERFCLPVLDVEEVLDWPLLTRLQIGIARSSWTDRRAAARITILCLPQRARAILPSGSGRRRGAGLALADTA